MSFLKKKEVVKHSTGIDVLKSQPIILLGAVERIKMTTSCKDADSIKKVENAGTVQVYKGQKVQIMHNGMKVMAGGYHGDWMTEVIRLLKGHHEPQEELVFDELLKHIEPGASMIELGSFWAYYSIWFASAIPGAKVIGCEPDPVNMKIGVANAKLNDIDITFLEAAAGSKDGKEVVFTLDSDPSKQITTKIRTVDSIISEYKIEKLAVLHMDIQGVELDALRGASKSIASGKIRFMVVSTHHYFFAGDPMNHEKCLEYMKSNGARIILEHTPYESYSGDGLIVASFDAADSNIQVNISYNRAKNSLYRTPEEDVSILLGAYSQGRES